MMSDKLELIIHMKAYQRNKKKQIKNAEKIEEMVTIRFLALSAKGPTHLQEAVVLDRRLKASNHHAYVRGRLLQAVRRS